MVFTAVTVITRNAELNSQSGYLHRPDPKMTPQVLLFLRSLCLSSHKYCLINTYLPL